MTTSIVITDVRHVYAKVKVFDCEIAINVCESFGLENRDLVVGELESVSVWSVLNFLQNL